MVSDIIIYCKKNIPFKKDTIKIRSAKCSEDIKRTIKELIESSGVKLPCNKNSSILIKPNLNNDLNALTGNSSDFRIIAGVIEALKDKRYSNITIADGSNVGVDRREIDVFRRLRIDRLVKFYGIKSLNLNHDASSSSIFSTGSIDISDACLKADFFINIPKLKTHTETGMSLAVKSLMGCVKGQQKRKMHLSLPENLVRINEIVKPHLYIVDGIIAMEGNGPGDGRPKNTGIIGAGSDPFLIDLVFAKLFGFVWKDIGYLKIAYEKGYITDEDIEVINEIKIIDDIQKAPKRGQLAELSETRTLYWLKLLVRPLVALRPVTELAYRLKIIQDVYNLQEDQIEKIIWNPHLCKDKCTGCVCFCPIDFEKIKSDAKADSPVDGKFDLSVSPFCIRCLYCYFVCPENAITLKGELGFLRYHIEKYRNIIS